MVNNYKILVQYDGTEYYGWQFQRPGLPTIQAEIMRVLQIIAKKRVVVTGSSRTDAGVHAAGLIANFHLPLNIEPRSLQKALNTILPKDIRIITCENADKSFNARFGATSKTYIYRIYFGQVQSPFASRFAAHIPYPIDLKAMRRALKYFLGAHDFSSFTSDEPSKKRVREIDRFSMRVRGEEITFTITGKSFLRYMVRNIVGTIIDIGRGKMQPEDLPAVFAAKSRRQAGQTAPAKGLTLAIVEY